MSLTRHSFFFFVEGSSSEEVCLYVEVHMRRVGVLVNKPVLDPAAALSSSNGNAAKPLFQ
jgi:hypothetical protein